tara:strand:+ start:57 stop:506 length:450 start_codon:yes stop_codon:yes gene_type:complete
MNLINNKINIMKDNFDLKAFLKENKTIENSNKYLAEDNKTEEDPNKDLKAKIREMVLAEMNKPKFSDDDEIFEAKEEEEVDVDVEEEEVEVVDSEEFEDMPEEEAVVEDDDIMGHLEAAMEAARSLGDEKLIDQLGNTITFYTRQHISK